MFFRFVIPNNQCIFEYNFKVPHTMKNYTVPLFVLLFSVSVFSQTQDDYTNTLNLVSKAFNEKKAALIHSLHNEKGKMSSYDLITDEEREKNYLVEFENSSMLLLINLTKEGQISLFKIKEY